MNNLRSPYQALDPFEADADITLDDLRRVHDGDTYYIPGQREPVRVGGIQAAEMYNPYKQSPRQVGAREATEALAGYLNENPGVPDYAGYDTTGRRLVSEDPELAAYMAENLHAAPMTNFDNLSPDFKQTVQDAALRGQLNELITNQNQSTYDPNTNPYDLTHMPTPRDPSFGVMMSRAVPRGIDQMQGNLYGGAHTLTRLAESVTGADLTGIKDWAEQGVKRNEAEAAMNPARFNSYHDINGIGDIVPYAFEKAAESLPHMLPYALGGGVGGAVAKTALGRVAGGVLGQAAAKQAVKKGAKEAFSKWGTRIGATAGGTLGHSGEIENEMTQAGGYEVPAWQTLAASVARAGLDTFGMETMLGRVIGETAAKSAMDVAKNVAKGMGVGALAEGPTEAAQEAIAIGLRAVHDPNYDWQAEAPERLTEAFIGGAAAGGLMGGVGQGAKSTLDALGARSEKPADTTGGGDLTTDSNADPNSDPNIDPGVDPTGGSSAPTWDLNQLQREAMEGNFAQQVADTGKEFNDPINRDAYDVMQAQGLNPTKQSSVKLVKRLKQMVSESSADEVNQFLQDNGIQLEESIAVNAGLKTPEQPKGKTTKVSEKLFEYESEPGVKVEVTARKQGDSYLVSVGGQEAVEVKGVDTAMAAVRRTLGDNVAFNSKGARTVSVEQEPAGNAQAGNIKAGNTKAGKKTEPVASVPKQGDVYTVTHKDGSVGNVTVTRDKGIYYITDDAGNTRKANAGTAMAAIGQVFKKTVATVTPGHSAVKPTSESVVPEEQSAETIDSIDDADIAERRVLIAKGKRLEIVKTKNGSIYVATAGGKGVKLNAMELKVDKLSEAFGFNVSLMLNHKSAVTIARGKAASVNEEVTDSSTPEQSFEGIEDTAIKTRKVFVLRGRKGKYEAVETTDGKFYVMTENGAKRVSSLSSDGVKEIGLEGSFLIWNKKHSADTVKVLPRRAKQEEVTPPDTEKRTQLSKEETQAKFNTLELGDVIENDMGETWTVVEVLRNKNGDVTHVLTQEEGESKPTDWDLHMFNATINGSPYIDANTGERKFSQPGKINKATTSKRGVKSEENEDTMERGSTETGGFTRPKTPPKEGYYSGEEPPFDGGTKIETEAQKEEGKPQGTTEAQPKAGKSFTIVSNRGKYDVLGMRGNRGRHMNSKKMKPGQMGWLGNPFKEGVNGIKSKAEAVAKFKEVFLEKIGKDQAFKKAVLALKGKTIGYDQPNESNHLQVIQEWLAQQPDAETEAEAKVGAEKQTEVIKEPEPKTEPDSTDIAKTYPSASEELIESQNLEHPTRKVKPASQMDLDWIHPIIENVLLKTGLKIPSFNLAIGFKSNPAVGTAFKNRRVVSVREDLIGQDNENYVFALIHEIGHMYDFSFDNVHPFFSKAVKAIAQDFYKAVLDLSKFVDEEKAYPSNSTLEEVAAIASAKKQGVGSGKPFQFVAVTHSVAYYGKVLNGEISDYKELFADSFALYFLDPEYLYEISPTAFFTIKKLTGVVPIAAGYDQRLKSIRQPNSGTTKGSVSGQAQGNNSGIVSQEQQKVQSSDASGSENTRTVSEVDERNQEDAEAITEATQTIEADERSVTEPPSGTDSEGRTAREIKLNYDVTEVNQYSTLRRAKEDLIAREKEAMNMEILELEAQREALRAEKKTADILPEDEAWIDLLSKTSFKWDGLRLITVQDGKELTQQEQDDFNLSRKRFYKLESKNGKYTIQAYELRFDSTESMAQAKIEEFINEAFKEVNDKRKTRTAQHSQMGVITPDGKHRIISAPKITLLGAALNNWQSVYVGGSRTIADSFSRGMNELIRRGYTLPLQVYKVVGKNEFINLPEHQPGQKTMTYAGIGSRETPDAVLKIIQRVAKELADKGYTLRTGDAEGADTAFFKGAGAKAKKEQYTAQDAANDPVAQAVAQYVYPWMLDPNSKAFLYHSRNGYELFGKGMDAPVDFVLAYEPKRGTSWKHSLKGGTGHTIRLASAKGIPVINLANKDWREQLDLALEGKKAGETPIQVTERAAQFERTKGMNPDLVIFESGDKSTKLSDLSRAFFSSKLIKWGAGDIQFIDDVLEEKYGVLPEDYSGLSVAEREAERRRYESELKAAKSDFYNDWDEFRRRYDEDGKLNEFFGDYGPENLMDDKGEAERMSLNSPDAKPDNTTSTYKKKNVEKAPNFRSDEPRSKLESVFDTIAERIGMRTHFKIFRSKEEMVKALRGLESRDVDSKGRKTKQRITKEEQARLENAIAHVEKGGPIIIFNDWFNWPQNRIPFIYIPNDLNTTQSIRAAAHEFGHLVKRVLVDRVIQKAVQKDPDAIEVVKFLFPEEVAADILKGGKKWMADEANAYMDELFAINMERWVNSNEVPKNVVQAFFKKAVKLFEKLYNEIRQRAVDLLSAKGVKDPAAVNEQFYRNFEEFMQALVTGKDLVIQKDKGSLSNKAISLKQTLEITKRRITEAARKAPAENKKDLIQIARELTDLRSSLTDSDFKTIPLGDSFALNKGINEYLNVLDNIADNWEIEAKPIFNRTNLRDFFTSGEVMPSVGVNDAVTGRRFDGETLYQDTKKLAGKVGVKAKGGKYTGPAIRWVNELGKELNALSPVVRTVRSELDSIGGVTAQFIKEKFKLIPSEILIEEARWLPELAKVLNGLPKPSGKWVRNGDQKAEDDAAQVLYAKIAEHLNKATDLSYIKDPQVRKGVQQVREYLDNFMFGDEGLNDKYNLNIPRRERYFTGVLNMDKWHAGKEEIVEILRTKMKVSVETAASLWLEIGKRSDGVLLDLDPSVMDHVLAPNLNAKYKRFFTPEVKEALWEYYESDIHMITSAYTRSAIRRGIMQSHFGMYDMDPATGRYKLNGDKKRVYNPMGKLDYFLGIEQILQNDRTGEGITEAQAIRIKGILLPALMGRLGANHVTPKMRSFMSWTKTYFNISLLSLATLSSLPELGGIKMKLMEDPRYTKNMGLMKGILEHFSNPELRRLATEFGIIMEDMVEHSLSGDMHNGYMVPGAQKVNNAFFKFVQMKRWADFTRIVAMRLAHSAFTEAYKAGDKAYLAQYGLNFRDVTDMDDANQNYKMALHKWVDEAVLRPGAMFRPAWGSDARKQLLWYLMDYMWLFYETTMKVTSRAMSNREGLARMMPMIALGAVMLPLAAIGYELRKLITQDLVADALGSKYKSKELDDLEYLWEITQRSGLLGPAQKLVDYDEATNRNKSAVINALGPIAEATVLLLDEGLDEFLIRYSPGMASSAPLRQEYAPGIRKMLSFED